MNAAQFVNFWKNEKDSYLTLLRKGDLLASKQIASLSLSASQTEILNTALDTVLTDIMYTLLLGLDGSTQIGGIQHKYEIRDESGNSISPDGELEAEAFVQFHAHS
ncbi:hypothetical protein [Luteimonas panaciterrae]|uniref:hypothetical protein n=1 Tax=Luteimonas panaciterrae TaxID=363885 RepID=UPI001CFA999C|nr:hypothetical protein [Luteimonas panaciterrae]